MKRVVAIWLVALSLLASCTGETTVDATTEPNPTATATPEQAVAPPPEQPTEQPVEPVPYIPAGSPGNADDYAELVARLEQLVPAELRNQVPWPELRNPNPIVAQVEIFELWIWMAANFPEPDLVEVMAAPRSHSREEIVGVFGGLERRNHLETRTGRAYEATGHIVVTFESAGLPLWLARDVPADAVVVYYSDSSGPVTVTDRDTGEHLADLPATPMRTWLSIMVPTDVGWQLWRDQVIEASNGLEVPDVPPRPGESEDDERTPEL